MYTQVFDPMGNMALSALIAFIPIVFFFLVLVILKVKGYWAGLMTAGLAIALAVLFFQMPLNLAVVSAVHGFVYGFFPIGWIVLAATFLYNLTVETGQFEIIKKSISSITDDRRLQVLLICFCFGAFLEGAAGFGTPVAITAAMLVGLGFRARYAACLALLANTAPVAFGGLGIPVLVAAQVTGLDSANISRLLAWILPLIGIIIPFYIVIVMSGIKGVWELFPAIVVCSGSFAIVLGLTSYFLGPVLPDITASIACLVCMTLFLKIWKPAAIFRFENDVPIEENKEKLHMKDVIRAWSPFIILIIMIADWGIKSVLALLNTVTIAFPVPIINNAIISGTTHKALPMIFSLNWLSAAGTAIVLAALVSCIVLRVSPIRAIKIFISSCKQLRWTFVVIGSVLGYAYVGNNSGMITTMGYFVAGSGALFPLFASIIGWIGTFVTGSDTSANALFAKLQTTAFEAIGSSGFLGVGANLAGGGLGKMISPQSIAIAAAVTNIVGEEGELYKFSMKHSIILLTIVSIYIYMIAGPLNFLIPVVKGEALAASAVDPSLLYQAGAMFLAGTVVLFAIFAVVFKPIKNKI